MVHLLCIICPPLAVLVCGKPFSAILNVALTFCLAMTYLAHHGVRIDAESKN